MGWVEQAFNVKLPNGPQDIEGPPHVKIKMTGEETEFATHLLRKQIMTNYQSWTNFRQTEIEEIFALC